VRVVLTREVDEALGKLAYKELRDPRAQAAICIRESLELRGLLPRSAETARLLMGAQLLDAEPAAR
jgi:hypothetical protein